MTTVTDGQLNWMIGCFATHTALCAKDICWNVPYERLRQGVFGADWCSMALKDARSLRLIGRVSIHQCNTFTQDPYA